MTIEGKFLSFSKRGAAAPLRRGLTSLPAILAWLLAAGVSAQTYQVIHHFGPGFVQPESALIADAAGNLCGTTRGGGASGLGTVFRLDAANGDVETVFRNDIAAGCGGGAYCRNNPITRAPMAVLLLKGTGRSGCNRRKT